MPFSNYFVTYFISFHFIMCYFRAALATGINNGLPRELSLSVLLAGMDDCRFDCQRLLPSSEDSEGEVGASSSPHARGGWGAYSHSSGSSPRVESASTLSSVEGFCPGGTLTDEDSSFVNSSTSPVKWRCNPACGRCGGKKSSKRYVGSIAAVTNARVDLVIPCCAGRRTHMKLVKCSRLRCLPKYLSLNLPDKQDDELFYFTWPLSSNKYKLLLGKSRLLHLATV